MLDEIICKRRNNGQNSKTWALFIDFSKAFDVVNHDMLWFKLEKVGVKDKFLRNIQRLYKNSKSFVVESGAKSEDFCIKQGTAQGCPLSVVLVNVLMHVLLRALDAAGPCLVSGYADDITLDCAADPGAPFGSVRLLRERLQRCLGAKK